MTLETSKWMFPKMGVPKWMVCGKKTLKWMMWRYSYFRKLPNIEIKKLQMPPACLFGVAGCLERVSYAETVLASHCTLNEKSDWQWLNSPMGVPCLGLDASTTSLVGGLELF